MYRRTVNSMRPPLLLIAAAVVSVAVAASRCIPNGPHVVGRLERSGRSSFETELSKRPSRVSPS